MKTAYNIVLPIIHVAFAGLFCYLSFLRYMVLAFGWHWLIEVVYVLSVVLILAGHYFLLRWGNKRSLLTKPLLYILSAIDYIVFGLHLGIAFFVLLPIVTNPIFMILSFYGLYLICIFVPPLVICIVAIILRRRSRKLYLFFCE